MSLSPSATDTETAMREADFGRCPICDSGGWSVVYSGPVRDGRFGKSRAGLIARCGGCGVDRLAESLCLTDTAYQGQYRDHLEQGHDIDRHFAEHDELARFTLDTLWPTSLRGKIVADVGCGGGSLLDHLRGVAGKVLALDPDKSFATSLQERDYKWYPGAEAAAADWGGKVDVAFSIQVIEHVSDPREFLSGIRTLLNPNGVLILSTPNRSDILLDLLPEEFGAFFYRTHHRWYFDAAALTKAAEAAGLRVEEVRHVHRYGMANALFWLRDRRPSGRKAIEAINRDADNMWRNWLEASGRSDNLYLILRPA